MMTTSPEVAHAPGCYGSALAYKANDPQCISCAFTQQCGPRAVERLAALRARYGIEDSKSKVERPTVKVASGETLTVPIKVADLIGRIERAGISVTDKLKIGVNPFPSTPTFLRIACHLLLKVPNGFTRQTLTTAFATKLNWTQQTAASHTSVTVGTLTALGVIEEQNGRLFLRKEIKNAQYFSGEV